MDVATPDYIKDDRRFATVTVNCASYGHDARAVGDEASTRTDMDAVTTPSYGASLYIGLGGPYC